MKKVRNSRIATFQMFKRRVTKCVKAQLEHVTRGHRIVSGNTHVNVCTALALSASEQLKKVKGHLRTGHLDTEGD